MTIAQELAQFVVNTTHDEIPARALDYAAMLISSTVASAAMGASLESVRIMRSMLVERGGTGEASIWFGDAPRLPVASAARINALMSDAAASDDSDLRNITHPGTALVAASLAMAEKTQASGADILRAIALGYEVAGRINTGVVPGLIWEKGFHGCMIAIFGAAVAATSNAGLLVAANTSMAREHHAGLAASLGVEAAQLASLGYTVEQSVLEHPKGFFFAYGQDAHATGRVGKVTLGLGEHWMILTVMAIKLVPGGHPYNAIAEAAAHAAKLGNVRASDVTAIICSRPDAHQIKGPRHPTDLIGIAHSPYYFAAAGVADHAFSWAHAAPAKIMDPVIRRLLDLVEIGPPPTNEVERYRQGASVTIKTCDGKSHSHTVYAPRGSAAIGIEWADVEAKFNSLCPLADMAPSTIEQAGQLLRRFREVTHIQELMVLIR
jgi:2-methylcitrate dehydratase PrpD